jgi:hypothetical protein
MTTHRISLRLLRLCLPPPAPGTICAAVSTTGFHPALCFDGQLIFGRLTIYSLRP